MEYNLVPSLNNYQIYPQNEIKHQSYRQQSHPINNNNQMPDYPLQELESNTKREITNVNLLVRIFENHFEENIKLRKQ